jgi:hypothetical protein
MLKNNIYNIDREFDYAIIKAVVIQSLEKIVKEEVLKNRANIYQDVIFDSKDNDDHQVNDHQVNVNNLLAHPSYTYDEAKIRNTTKYLNWRLSILKRDNFTCKICHASEAQQKLKTRGTSSQQI